MKKFKPKGYVQQPAPRVKGQPEYRPVANVKSYKPAASVVSESYGADINPGLSEKNKVDTDGAIKEKGLELGPTELTEQQQEDSRIKDLLE